MRKKNGDKHFVVIPIFVLLFNLGPRVFTKIIVTSTHPSIIYILIFLEIISYKYRKVFGYMEILHYIRINELKI